ncbi:Zinc finger RING/FYVE/PHD-type protein [Dioscorea alata]|uniref:Zinc finger RING/FYVE/PHD-type protein n=1 Tax=Dioscorea alata TaxID=55571 RepID=A0ACB7V8A4_DIOAL|nr:Zinc finger RING/FYVE/PHD-type protein [Dioscorea alata]
MDTNKSHSSSETSFPILAVSLLGIITTAILLVSYYLYVVKCCRRRREMIGRWRESPCMNQGLTEQAIQAIPIIQFRADRSSFHECSVCLNEFQEDERLKILPHCFHVFHMDCIDTWLQSNSNCPVCRGGISSRDMFSCSKDFISQDNESIVIQVGDDDLRMEAQINNPSPVLHKVGSMGDECIDLRNKDEQFDVPTVRRSFSLDSSNNKQLYLLVQRILQHNPHLQ